MEDVAEDTVIHEFLVIIIRLFQISHIMVEEPQLAAQIRADGCRTDASVLLRKALFHNGHYLVGLDDFLRTFELCLLSCLKRLVLDRFRSLYHLL